MGRTPTCLRTRAATLAIAVLLIASAAVSLAPAAALAAPKPGPQDPAPVIDALSVYSGGPGTQVTITGSDFGTKTQWCDVYFAGTAAKVVSLSDTRIVAVVPSGAQAGYVWVEVRGQVSNGVYYFPFDPPEITALSDNSAAVGAKLMVTGTGFGSTVGSGSVTFAGVAATVLSWSDTSIVVAVPDAVAGYVGVWQNGICSNGLFFIPGGMPAIDGVSQQFAIVGETVTVTGQNFGSGPQGTAPLTLGGLPVAPASWSDTQITFAIPNDAPTGYIGVWKGDVCSNGAFLNVGGRITALSSWWGAPGSEITIDGVGFGATQDRVTVAGVEAQVTSWSDARITFVVPVAPEGYVGVWRDATCSNGMWLLPIDRATVSSIDCTTAAPGATITITGTGFEAAQAANYRVMIGTNEIDVVSWSDTQIVATVPTWLADAGYLGVWKKGVASNGVWIEVTP